MFNLGVRIVALTVAFVLSTPNLQARGWVRNVERDMLKTEDGSGAKLRATRALIENDNLIPTQNRTQAMRIEAATGHLPPEEEQILIQRGILPSRTKPSPGRKQGSSQRQLQSKHKAAPHTNYAYMNRVIQEAARSHR